MRVLVADDHPLFRDALARLVARVFQTAAVTEADSYDAVLRHLDVYPDFDLVLVDLRMPGGDSHEMLRRLHVRHPQVPIVVVSGAEHAWEARRALQAGAVGYLSKSVPEPQMRASLERIVAGEAPLQEPASPAMPVAAGGTPSHVRGIELTPRQQQVLELICAGESNKLIARRLGLSVGTVKLHVCAILQALEVESRTQAVVKAHALGHASPPAD